MRVLLSTIGSRGDVQPLVALAAQLRSLGNDVHLCVPPDFCDWIGRLGMPVTPIGFELRKMTAASGSATSATFSDDERRQRTAAAVAMQFEIVGRAAVGCDLIVAATFLQIAARSIAEAMSIPYVFVAYCPVVLPSPHHAPPPLPPIPARTKSRTPIDNRTLWTREAQRFNDLFGPSLNSHRASIGLSPVTDVRRHIFTDRPWLAADPALAPWPDPADQSVFQTGAWLLQDDDPLPRELEAFLESGERPVYIGFGSMRAASTLSQMMVAAARALGLRVVVSRGWADLSDTRGDPDCIVIGEVNQQALFTRIAAVVHHGGAGTTTTAAIAGVPQILIPQMYDQWYWGQRIHDLGIGTVYTPGARAANGLRTALTRVLGPDVAARARSFGATLGSDGAHAAACLLMQSSLL
jgi:vancomycin aglycone glucosyltransferase